MTPREVVAAACENDDLLAALPSFRTFMELDVAAYGPRTRVPEQEIAWALDLTRANMEKMYAPVWGAWSDAAKRAELVHEDARFLVAYREGTPVAFVHFRFELPADDLRAQVYVMDVQLSAGVRRRGLGRFLMRLVELLGRGHGMALVALTVMRANVAARALYRSLGFSEDGTQPEGPVLYQILSKTL